MEAASRSLRLRDKRSRPTGGTANRRRADLWEFAIGRARRSAKSGDRRATGNVAKTAENETVRVDRQRLDELINQIGELVIGASMVEQNCNPLPEVEDWNPCRRSARSFVIFKK